MFDPNNKQEAIFLAEDFGRETVIWRTFYNLHFQKLFLEIISVQNLPKIRFIKSKFYRFHKV